LVLQGSPRHHAHPWMALAGRFTFTARLESSHERNDPARISDATV
jgi:hypothetical protein